MENKEIINLEKEIESYKEAFDLYWNLEEIQRWKSIFVSTTNKTRNILHSGLDWEIKIHALRDILYFFAPRMGSFKEDCPEELWGKAHKLTSSTIDYLRYCWKMAGNETYFVPSNELFSVGQKVHLVKGQLMHLGFGGYKEIADFEEIHAYEIIEITGNDISSMPTYNIKFGSTIRNARHNSIEKVST